MLKYRTISIRSGLICWAAAFALVAWLVSRSAAQQVPAQAPGSAETKGAAGEGPGALPGTGPSTGPLGGAASAAEEPPTEAERAIDEAIRKIAKLQSVAANLEQDVDMLNLKFKVTGRYLKAPNTRLYLSLEISGLPDSGGRFLQVCDGETLWEYQLVLNDPFFRRLAIKPVLERLNSPDLDPEIRMKATTQMGVSGPETLLVGLRKIIRFDLKEAAVLDGRKVWKFHGIWKNRQGLVGPDARPVNPMGVLPPYIPMDATLYLGVDDSWPYQLILQGRAPTSMTDTRPIGPDGRPVGAKSSIEKIPRSVIKLTYTDVKLNANIRADEFVFQAPANASVADDTESLLKTLDRALENGAQKKKSEAAQKDGAVLDQPIDVPIPGGAPGESKPRE